MSDIKVTKLSVENLEDKLRSLDDPESEPTDILSLTIAPVAAVTGEDKWEAVIITRTRPDMSGLAKMFQAEADELAASSAENEGLAVTDTSEDV